MKRIIPLLVLLLIVFIGSNASAARRSKGSEGLGVSVSQNSILGDGVGDNSFDSGMGFSLALVKQNSNNSAATSYGVSWFDTVNRVGTSAQEVLFYAPACVEHRFYKGSGTVRFFLLLGADWWRMKFDSSKGADDQLWLSIGVGLQVGNKAPLQIKVKPYRIFSNDLGQNTAISLVASFGFA